MATLTLVTGYIICVLLGLVGLVIVWKILDGSIDLSALLEETNGGASMSRFQLLIFTFVFAFSLFLVIISTTPNPSFPNIPGTVLSLLGISGSSYLVSKGIQFSDPAGLQRGTDVVVSPARAILALGKTQQFAATVAGKPNAQVKWEVIAGLGTINEQGVYAAPAVKPADVAGHFHATIQVTSEDQPGAFDLAVITVNC